MKRLVTVLQTQGNNFSVESEAQQWGVLRTELEDRGANMRDKTVLISGLNLNIQHDEAQLPAGNFVLVVAPAKFKAAAMGYKELKAQLKEWYATYPWVRSIIGNYTQSSTVELQRKYDAARHALAVKGDEAPSETPSGVLTLEQRLLAVEIQLQMRNDANAEAFDAYFTEKYAAIK